MDIAALQHPSILDSFSEARDIAKRLSDGTDDWGYEAVPKDHGFAIQVTDETGEVVGFL